MLTIRNVVSFLFLFVLQINIASAKSAPWLDSFKPQRELFVSANGNGSGNNESDPMSLNSATISAQPGDLYWLLDGTYTGLIQLTRSGSAENPIVFRAKPGDRVIVNGAFQVDADFNWIWGMEITDPGGVANTPGITLYGDGDHAINNIVHHHLGNSGIGAWKSGKGQVVYGNIVYSQISNSNNPHNIYAQNEYAKDKYKYIVGNVLLDAFDATPNTYNFHAYTENGSVSGFYVKNNIIGNGEFLIGGYNDPADHEVVVANYFYNALAQFGYGVPSQIKMKKNYMGRTPLWLKWFWGDGETQFPQSQANVISKNEIVYPGGNHIEFRTSAFTEGGLCTGCVKIKSGDVFNNNKYSAPFNASFYADDNNRGALKFDEWKSSTANAGNGFDKNSSELKEVTPHRSFVIPNDYEEGRGHLAIYNWDGSSSVSVNLSAVVSNGQNFKVFDARDVFGTPVASGVYQGPVDIPMGGNEFGAFLIVTN
jgi:hypothetical protein